MNVMYTMEGVNTLVLIVMEATLVHVMMDTHWMWMTRDAHVSGIACIIIIVGIA